MAILFGAIAMLLFILVSCSKEKKEFVDITFDREQSFTIRTTDVLSYISDSGIVKYKLQTKLWLVFNEAAEPYSYFPEKVHVEQLDSLFQPCAHIDADTAYYYTKKNLFKFVGNVEYENEDGDRLETSLLYWNMDTEKIYSDQFVRYTRGEFVDYGVGFEANQTLTYYEIYHAGAEIPFQNKKNAANDTLSVETDTINVENAPSD